VDEAGRAGGGGGLLATGQWAEVRGWRKRRAFQPCGSAFPQPSFLSLTLSLSISHTHNPPRRPAHPKPGSDPGAELETIALVSGDGGGGGGEDGGEPDGGFASAPTPRPRLSPRRHAPAAPAAPPPAPCAPPSAPERSTLKAAALVAPLWFAAQLTFNASLARTSVTSNTILSSASGLFTYALSAAFLGEPRTWGRLASVMACMAGTGLVAGADALTGRAGRGGGGGGGQAPPRPGTPSHGGLAGDALALASSLLYACYTVALRALLPEEGEGGAGSAGLTALFFGGVGVANLALGAPVLAAASAAGALRRAGTPPGSPLFTRGLLGAVLGKGLLDNVLSDFLWARAVLLVGPTVATVGLNVQVPLAAALDACLRSPGWARSVGGGLMTGGGALLVVAGVCGIARAPAGEVVEGFEEAARDDGALPSPQRGASPP